MVLIEQEERVSSFWVLELRVRSIRLDLTFVEQALDHNSFSGGWHQYLEEWLVTFSRLLSSFISVIENSIILQKIMSIVIPHTN